MHYQSLYRRYRPQRFGDVAGQDHVSATLRNAVVQDRVAHAYLFSGPRGCGKTTSARILAKALNCTDIQDGEPCCVCDSCVLVQSGTSMDVIELDAASNNGVDAMRDLVSRAALGTAGRRKVYIVDEVHMLSTAASNALLKTLEEPPDHVVFVLATTDPQKVLPTIRSRTQSFEFRLFTYPALLDLVRKVAADAGIDLPDEALQAVARRGNGSARDALSALDQASAAGGLDDGFDIGELVRAIAEADGTAVLVALDRAIERGRDPRQLARDVTESLRNVFLVHMGRLANADPAMVSRMPPAAATRGIEVVGEALVNMRDAIDPRIVLEVALLRLVRPDLDRTAAALLQRIEALEARVVGTMPSPPAHVPFVSTPTPSPTPPPTPTTPPPTTSPVTSASPPLPPASADAPAPPVASPDDYSPPAALQPTAAEPALLRGDATSEPRPAIGVVAPRTLPTLRPPSAEAPASAVRRAGPADAARAQLAVQPTSGAAATGPRLGASPNATRTPPAVPDPVLAGAGAEPEPVSLATLGQHFESIVEKLPPRPRALFRVGRVQSTANGHVIVTVPNAAHLERAREHETDLAAALSAAVGPITLELGVADDSETGPGTVSETAAFMPPPVAPPDLAGPDDDVDLSALVDAPNDPGISAIDQISAVFPGTQLVSDEGAP